MNILNRNGTDDSVPKQVPNKELKEYVETVMDAIIQGTEKYKSCIKNNKVTLELEIVNTQEVKGGFKIFVANASGKSSKEKTSRIVCEFELGNTTKFSTVRIPKT